MSRYSVRLAIDSLPACQTGNGHWRRHAKDRKAWHLRIALELGDDIPPKPLEIAALRYTRHSNIAPDYDNLVISFKAIQDALVSAGVLLDDTMRNTIGFDGPVPEYRWEQAPRGQGFVEIEVEER